MVSSSMHTSVASAIKCAQQRKYNHFDSAIKHSVYWSCTHIILLQKDARSVLVFWSGCFPCCHCQNVGMANRTCVSNRNSDVMYCWCSIVFDRPRLFAIYFSISVFPTLHRQFDHIRNKTSVRCSPNTLQDCTHENTILMALIADEIDIFVLWCARKQALSHTHTRHHIVLAWR